MNEPNHYEVLDVEPTATPEEIRRAYRRQIRQCHPDKPRGGDIERARALDEARTVLLDPVARAKYDAKQAGTDLLDEAMDALSEFGNRAIDRFAVTVQVRGHDLLGALRTKAAQALRKR